MREECKDCGHHSDQKTPTYLSLISSGFHKGKIFNVDHTVTGVGRVAQSV